MAKKSKTTKEILAVLNKDVRPWFKNAAKDKHFPLEFLVDDFEYKGYVLESNGLMRRELLTDEEMKKAGHTIMDIALLRPSTYHSLRGIAELAEITGGFGLHIHKNLITSVKAGQRVYIPPNEPFGWVPTRNSYLSMHLVFSGIFDNTKEKTLLSFEDLETYITKYMPALNGSKI